MNADVLRHGATSAGAMRPVEPSPFDAMLNNVQRACELRLAQLPDEGFRRPQISANPWTAGGAFLIANLYDDGIYHVPAVIGVLDHAPIETEILAFLDGPCRAHHRSPRRPELVYSGVPLHPEYRDVARERGVRLYHVAEYEQVWNPTSYLDTQRRVLEGDGRYQLRKYVDKAWTSLDHLGGGGPDLAEEMIRTLRADGPRFVLVLGEFGTGKTFLMRHLAASVAERIPRLVPVLVTMRELEKARSLHELVSQHMARRGQDPFHFAAFRYMLERGRIALLVDGFDEHVLRADYERVADHFAALRDAATGAAKVIVTSRYEHFASDRAVSSALGPVAERIAGSRVIRVEPLSDPQKRALASKEFSTSDEAVEYMTWLERLPSLDELAVNSRLLTLMFDHFPVARLITAARDGAHYSKSTLYKELVHSWLEHETTRQTLPGGPRPLSKDQRKRIVSEAAFAMWQAGVDRISLADLGSAADEGIDIVALGMRRNEVQHAAGSATLLRRTGDEEFGFAHQSVMEWLLADRLAEQMRELPSEPHELRMKPLDDVLADHLLSPLTVEFLLGLGDPAAVEDWAVGALTKGAADGWALKLNASTIIGHRRRSTFGRSVRLVEEQLAGANLSGWDLVKADMARADLNGANLSRADLRNAVLREVTARGLDAVDADLTGADLGGADLSHGRLMRAKLRQADLDGARLYRAALLGASVETDTLSRAADVTGAALPGDVPVPQISTSGAASAVAFSADGRLLASAGAEGVVRLWDSQTGEEIRGLPGHVGAISTLSFSADDRILATAGRDRVVRLWEVGTSKLVRTIEGHEGGVTCMAWSPGGGALVTGSMDSTVRMWIRATGRCRMTFAGHRAGIVAVAFNRDGTVIASAGDDRRTRLWDVKSGALLGDAVGPEGWIVGLHFVDGDRLVATTSEGEVWAWDPSMQRGSAVLALRGQVTASVVCPDRRLLAMAFRDRPLQVLDVTSDQPPIGLSAHPGTVTSLAFGPAGDVLSSTGVDGVVRIWDLASDTELRSMCGHIGSAGRLAFSPDGDTLASAHANGKVSLWWRKTGVRIKTLPSVGRATTSIEFSRNSQLLVTGASDGSIRFWNPETASLICERAAHRDTVSSVVFSEDGSSFATASVDGSVCIWDTDKREPLLRLPDPGSSVLALAFSVRNTLAVGTSDGEVAVCDPSTGMVRWSERTGPSGIRLLVFHHNGRHLVSVSDDHHVRMWDTATRTQVAAVEASDRFVAASFSPDGALLSTATDDRTVYVRRMWDSDTALKLTNYRSGVRDLCFGPDGRYLAVSGTDGTIGLFDLASRLVEGHSDASRPGEPDVVLAQLGEGWAVLLPNGDYKLGGVPTGLWWAANLCTFAPGEVDRYVDSVRRLPDDERLWR